MKIVAFNDLHGRPIALKKLAVLVKKNKPDAVLYLGDFTLFERHIETVLAGINAFGSPVYLIHGNHEDETIVRKLCKNYPNITFIHKRIVTIGDVQLVAFGGGGFYGHGKLKRDTEFDAWILKNNHKLGKRTLLLTHGPPAHTVLDHIDYMDEHVGCPSFTAYIKKYKPLLALSGHIHESFGREQHIGPTKVCNVGPSGKVFNI